MPSFTDVTHGRHFDEMDPDEWETTRYACADSDYTLRLYYKFNAWFDRYLPRHRWIVEHLESPTTVYVGMMKYNGILMDQPLMADLPIYVLPHAWLENKASKCQVWDNKFFKRCIVDAIV